MNNYLDPSAQKAYIQGINGCVEHVQVVQEVIQHAKANNKTAHITWVDLVDAFGSLSHMLIEHVLMHYHIPTRIINYIKSIYSKLKGSIKTKNWESDVINFLKGAFQGDPYSGVIFLIAFNPLIEHIKKYKELQGYKIKFETEDGTVETNIITTPFADDFNLISKDKKLHQNLITEIEEKAKDMGFLFKPSKCSSLSICGGKPTNVTFVLTDFKGDNSKVPMETVHSNPHKFLGSLVTYTNTTKEYFEHFYKVFEEKLINIDQSRVRGEHKLAIYERHALPSMRYHLSIHDMHETHLTELDNIAKKYLKKWLSFPTRGVTDVGIFHPYLLNVKQPSHIYHEGHTGNLILMKFKGDKTVEACIQSKLERESKWKKKSSTIVKSNLTIAKIVTNGTTIQAGTGATKKNMNLAKKAYKQSIQEDILEKWNNKVKQLTLQGEFTKLLIEEKNSVTWQSIIRKMPRNVMSFAARLSTNSLATPSNLVRWGKRKMGSCPLCSNKNATLSHIVNFCPVSLDQGRYTWRHDSVLQHITKLVKTLSTPDTDIYADLNGWKINGGTIPADILVSSGKGSRPDLVLINRSERRIALLELTCSLPHNTTNAHNVKTSTYTQLKIALTEKGYTVELLPFEVCSNGHITNKNKQDISQILRKFNMNIKSKVFIELGQIALLCTMSVFFAYQSTEWTSPPLLSP